MCYRIQFRADWATRLFGSAEIGYLERGWGSHADLAFGRELVRAALGQQFDAACFVEASHQRRGPFQHPVDGATFDWVEREPVLSSTSRLMRGTDCGKTLPGKMFSEEWCTHQELNLEPSDP